MDYISEEDHIAIGNAVREKIQIMGPLLAQVMDLFSAQEVSLIDGGWVLLFMASVALSEDHRKAQRPLTKEQIAKLLTVFEHMLIFSYGQGVIDNQANKRTYDA